VSFQVAGGSPGLQVAGGFSRHPPPGTATRHLMFASSAFLS